MNLAPFSIRTTQAAIRETLTKRSSNLIVLQCLRNLKKITKKRAFTKLRLAVNACHSTKFPVWWSQKVLQRINNIYITMPFHHWNKTYSTISIFTILLIPKRNTWVDLSKISVIDHWELCEVTQCSSTKDCKVAGIWDLKGNSLRRITWAQ